MLCIQKCDMHLCQTEEHKQPIVYQVETGLFFELDTLFEAILECCEGLSVDRVVQVLADQYEAEEVAEAIEELAQVGLISDGALPVVSNVPTAEGVAACGASQTDRLQVSLHVSHTVQYSMRLLLCPRRRLWRQGHVDATQSCRASDTMDCY